MSAALRAHRRLEVLLAVLVPVLLYFVLLTTGSLTVVPSVLLFHHCLFGCDSVSDPLQRHSVVVYSFLDASPAPPTPQLSIAPLVIVGSR